LLPEGAGNEIVSFEMNSSVGAIDFGETRTEVGYGVRHDFQFISATVAHVL
jgi:hypothetical protein